MNKQPATQPLKIAFYAPALPDSGVNNGIVTYTRIMRDALRRQGHQVTVVTTNMIERADQTMMPLPDDTLIAKLGTWRESARSSDGSSPWVRYHVRRALREMLASEKPDVIEMEESFGWISQFARSRVVVERLHGPHTFLRDPFESEAQARMSDLREAAERQSFEQICCVTSPTKGLLDALAQKYDLEIPIARVIQNPMPVEVAENVWNLHAVRGTQILCVGRFDHCKGADVVLKAFDRAQQEEPKLSLLMVGPDVGLRESNGSQLFYDDFSARFLSDEARSRVQFLGPQTADRIAQLRKECLFCVVGSRFETFGYTIAEAMAVGMPVLTSATFGGRELIRDGIDGRIVPVGDVEQTAQAILEMTRNPIRLGEYGQASYARASQFLSPDRIARETVEVYRQAIAVKDPACLQRESNSF